MSRVGSVTSLFLDFVSVIFVFVSSVWTFWAELV